MKHDLPKAAFAALLLATVIAVFDLGMINLALPVIAAELKVPIADALWLSRANLLTCALTLLPCAALGDVLGHRRMLAAGLSLVTATLIGCALSHDLPTLIALRALQGAGSAAVMCSTLVLISAICPRRSLGKAMGINALFVAVTSTGGPALTGVLLHWLDWRWLFVLTIPAALLALLIGQATLPNPRVAQSRFDWQGAGLLLLLLGTLLSMASAVVPAGLAWPAGLVLGVAFMYRQHRCAHPLLPLLVFKNPRLNTALLASCLAFVGQSAAFIMVPLLLQRTLGYAPLQAAWVFIAWPLLTALSAPFAGHWADRFDARRIADIGTLVLTLGLISLAAMPEAPSGWDIAWRLGLCGIGFGLFQSPNNRAIVLNVPSTQTARGAALLCLARLLGQALGAVLVALALERFTDQAAISHSTTSAVLYGAAALQALTLVIALTGSVSAQQRMAR